MKRSFFEFPKRHLNPERRDKWLTALHRENPDGSSYSPPKARTICSDHFVTGKYNVMALARSVLEIRRLFIVGNSTVLTEVSSCTSRRPTKQGSSSPGLRPFNISSQGSKQCEGKKKPWPISAPRGKPSKTAVRAKWVQFGCRESWNLGHSWQCWKSQRRDVLRWISGSFRRDCPYRTTCAWAIFYCDRHALSRGGESQAGKRYCPEKSEIDGTEKPMHKTLCLCNWRRWLPSTVLHWADLGRFLKNLWIFGTLCWKKDQRQHAIYWPVFCNPC